MPIAEVRKLSREVEDLRAAKQQRGSKLARFLRYANDPVGFVRDVLGGNIWSLQECIAESVRDRPRTVVRGCNGSGKDFAAARIAIWWVLARGGFVVITSATDRQVRETMMGELRRALANVNDCPGELLEMAWRFDAPEPMGVLAFASNDESRLQGFHAPRLLLIVSEAQAIELSAWEGLLANVTGADNRVLAVGNPLVASGKFFDFNRSPEWHAIRMAASEHPNVIEGREVIPGAVTREFVAAQAREWGEGSSTYRARVEAEFADENDEGLIRRSWLDAAAARFDSKALEDAARGAEPVAAVDPARYGPDTSALALRQGPVLRELVTWNKCDLMQSTGRVVREVEARGITRGERVYVDDEAVSKWTGSSYLAYRGRVVVDENGVGGGVADRLREQDFRVVMFNGGHAPIRPQFLNRRAEAYWHLRDLLEAGRIALPRDEKLFDELTALRWTLTSEGKVKLEAKDDLRKRIGRSPDRADASAMAFWTFEQPGGAPKQAGNPVQWG